MTKPTVFNYTDYVNALDRIEQLENELNENRAEWRRDSCEFIYLYTCARCGHISEVPYSYCPSCGARMEDRNA